MYFPTTLLSSSSKVHIFICIYIPHSLFSTREYSSPLCGPHIKFFFSCLPNLTADTMLALTYIIIERRIKHKEKTLLLHCCYRDICSISTKVKRGMCAVYYFEFRPALPYQKRKNGDKNTCFSIPPS